MLNLGSREIQHLLNEIRRLFPIAYNHPEKVLRAGVVFFTEGTKGIKKRIRRQDILEDYQSYINAQYNKIWKKYYPTNTEIEKQKVLYKRFIKKPRISILLPTYNTALELLEECIKSVLAQSYENWQLCIADDASDNESVRKIIGRYSKLDPRIEYVFRSKRGHISEASNSALKLAKGEFIALLDHDDILWPNALFEVVKALNVSKSVKFLYSDEDKLEEDGENHVDPFFKPDYSPDYLRSINYIVHFAVIKRSLAEKIGGFRKGVEGAQDWDLFLRITNNLANEEVMHIPKILYSWRKSAQSSASERSILGIKDYAFKNQKKVLENDLKERGIKGSVLKTQYKGLWRVKYEILNSPMVSVIIPTIDNYEYIRRCLNSIITKTSYKNFEIVVVDTGSQDSSIFRLYDELQLKFKNFKVQKWSEKFNFSKVCNFGVDVARGEYLVFLNNDTEIISRFWIENMLEFAQRQEIGAVGCKLLFPNGRIQHVGVILGISGGMIRKGVAGHPFKNFYHKKINNGYSRIVDAVMNYSAVTAACLMVSKVKFKSVGGFDSNFRIAFNDVDFCLKLFRKGYFNLYTPYTTLIHHESVSVGEPGKGERSAREFMKEAKLMQKKWRKLLLNDPFYNCNLTLKNEEYTIKV